MVTDRIAFPHQISLLDLLLVAFAAKALIDFWKESTLMAGWRAYLEVRGGFLGELSECKFCLSYWACFLLTVLGRYLSAVLVPWVGLPLLIFLFALAATGFLHTVYDFVEMQEDDIDPFEDEHPGTLQLQQPEEPHG